MALARTRGFRIDERVAATQVHANAQILEKNREIFHQGFSIAAGDFFTDFVWGYVLLGLHAENYHPDLNTDAAALMIMSRQKPNGEWAYPHADTRPPICLNYVTQTALALRAIQFYAPKSTKAAADKEIRLAASWIANVQPSSNEDRTWRLIGLAWAGIEKSAMQSAMKDLLAAQRPDGGWSDLPAMQSSAFATGESLVALHTAGLPTADAAYQRGIIKFLLDTQQERWFRGA